MSSTTAIGLMRMPRDPLLEALVSIRAHIPDDAMSAGLLGTERAGHGIRVRDDGLIITIGYVINEAEEIWIGSHDGRAVPGFVVGNDFPHRAGTDQTDDAASRTERTHWECAVAANRRRGVDRRKRARGPAGR